MNAKRPRGRPPRRFRIQAGISAAIGVVLLASFAARPLDRHLRATAMILKVSGAPLPRPLALWSWSGATHEVEERTDWLESAGGRTRVRTYRPRDVSDPPGIVLVHGMHRLGIDEPRLQTFARALAQAGVLASTPELPGLMDYSVAPGSIDVIGVAARQLARTLHRSSVGVFGLSFAGSLSLLAAADPRYQRDIAFVVAMGGYHDLLRVTQFFIRDEVERYDGSRARLVAHPYGTLVVAYSHPEALFDPADVSGARLAIRAMLAEDRAGALTSMRSLTPAGRARVEVLFGKQRQSLIEPLLVLTRAQEPAMSRVSPRGRMGAIRVPIYLLAGSGDNVIPATETEWLAHDAPAAWLRSAVVSDAIGHVEMQGRPPLLEQWRLIHFLARVIGEAEAEPPSQVGLR